MERARARMQDVSDCRVVQRGDEAARRLVANAQRDRDAGLSLMDRNAGTTLLALDDGDVRQQRDARQHGPAEDLRGRVQREKALQDAGGRRCDRGERHGDRPRRWLRDPSSATVAVVTRSSLTPLADLERGDRHPVAPPAVRAMPASVAQRVAAAAPDVRHSSEARPRPSSRSSSRRRRPGRRSHPPRKRRGSKTAWGSPVARRSPSARGPCSCLGTLRQASGRSA